MGYILKAIFGKKSDLNPIILRYSKSKIIELERELSIIPMTEDLYDEINNFRVSNTILSFELLSENLEKEVLDLIGDSKIAYVESEFHGGKGGHSGIIWEDKKRKIIMDYDLDSMNKILKELGIKKESNKDEFDTVGLSKYRMTEDWIQATKE